jgi:outer membrane protein
MKNRIKDTFLLLAMAMSLNGFAQNADSVRQWHIEECFQYATDHNIQISTLRLGEQSYQQDLIAAKGTKIPSLSASVGNTFYNTNISSAAVNQFSSGGNYSVNSSIVLWNNNFINNNIKQRGLLAESAFFAIQQSKNSITLSITQAFLDILLAKENEKYIAVLVNTSESSLKRGQMLYDAGSIAQKEVLQLQAQLASDKYLLIQIQNTIRQNILTLKQLIQLPTNTLFDIATPLSLQIGTVLVPLHEVQKTAVLIFPEIKIGQLDVDIANLDIAKSKAGFLPILSASGGFGTGYNSAFTNRNSAQSDYFSQTGSNFSTHVGVTLFIPIFSNFINKTNFEKAKINYKQAQLTLQNKELVLSQAIERAYLTVENARQSYESANQQLLAATENYRVVNEQFKIGGLNSNDLLLQRNQYVQAVQAFTQAKYTLVLQQKIYQFYTGKVITL